MQPIGLLRGAFCAVFVMLAVSAQAQQLVPGGGSEEPPVVTTDDVRAALEELIATGEPPEAITTDDPEIEEGALNLLLQPLTLSQLQTEIDGWFDMFKETVAEVTASELELFEMNAAEEAAAAEAEADAEGEGQTDADTSESGAETDEISPEEEALVEKISELRSARTGVADRLRLVMDAFEAKGGDPAATQEIRNYIGVVGGVKVDTQDLSTAWLTLREWAQAEDGGLRLARHVGTVVGATLVGAVLGWLLSFVVNIGLRQTALTSKLLRIFLRRWIARLGALVGLLYGLSMIGTNMTPILAGLGAAGFILAFALQNTISNFASGLLIMFQRPFDAGDEIEAAGTEGEVEHVSLFSTHLSTAENRKVIVPNNMIWDDVIVNSTGAPTRRLAIEIEVDANEHSLDEAEEILQKVMEDHPGVLDDPAPDLKLSAMGADSLTFICWPWVLTEEKDKMRWDLVARFGRELSMVRGATKAGEGGDE
ncbi:MAG: mechanosensitive ion channel domain-containing protein [Pseudomonadota bacterium]